MPFDAVKVEGLAQLEQSLREVGRGIQANLNRELLVAAQPAKALAEQFGVQRIRGIRKSGWNEMKLGTSGAIVYMAPAKRSTRNPRRRRPNLGRLLVDKAMEPALAATTPQIEAGAERAVERAIRTAGFQVPFKDAEKARECKRRYRDRNRELLRAKGREYQQRRYAKDDEYAEWQRNYQRRRLEEEPEVIRERDRRSYEKHAVERREKSKRWREQNPVHFRVLRANGAHRRRVRIAGVKSESIDRVVVWIRDRGRCHICGLRTDLLKFHLDHVVPIAKGGDHTYSNVAVSHPSCNLAKGSKLMSEVR